MFPSTFKLRDIMFIIFSAMGASARSRGHKGVKPPPFLSPLFFPFLKGFLPSGNTELNLTGTSWEWVSSR